MQTAGVEEALVYHTVARDAHPPLGNSLLLKELEGQDGLYPVWVLLPHHTGEMPAPRILLEEARKKGIQAVRFYPGRVYHSFSLEEWCAGELLDALEQARMPVVLDAEIESWEAVASLLKRYRRMPVVMANCTYRFNRFTYPLLEKYDNLYIETSRFLGGGAVEDMVKHFGPRPLLFGSNMPRYTGTAAVALITYAEIDQDAKQAIAGGNLKRLLGEMWP
jgi:predicted TIM-barrel fold metal-dependent hydrolase